MSRETQMGLSVPFDWDTPRYAQSEVLQLVPRLTAKNLQNWLQRGLLKSSNPGTRGKGDHRRYTRIGIVILDFVATLTAFGVPLAEAFDLADEVADAAEALQEKLQDWPSVKSPGGVDLLEVSNDQLKHLQRAIISTLPEGGFYLFPTTGLDDAQRMFNGPAYLVVEHELRVIDVINRMRLLDAGEVLK